MMNMLPRMFVGFFIELLRHDDPQYTVVAPVSVAIGLPCMSRSRQLRVARLRHLSDTKQSNHWRAFSHADEAELPGL